MSEQIKIEFLADPKQVEMAASRVNAAMKSVSKTSVQLKQIGLPVAEFTPQSLASIERAAFLQQDLARKTYMAGASGKSGALGFLAFSQAVEDSAYGIRGVLNNIPQMVLGFGGGAGLAGAMSLAAVAAYGLYRAYQNLSGATEDKAFKSAAEAGKIAYESAIKAATAIRESAAAQELYNSTLAQEAQYLNDRIQLHGQMTSYYDQQLASRKRQIAAEQEIYQLALRNTQAAGGDATPLIEQEFSNQQRNLAEELANRTKELANVQADLMRQTEERERLTAQFGEDEIARREYVLQLEEERAKLVKDIAESEKRRDYAKKAATPTTLNNSATTDLMQAFGGTGQALPYLMGPQTAAIPSELAQKFKELGQSIEETQEKSRGLFVKETGNVRTYKERLAEVEEALKKNESIEKGVADARQQAISSLTASIDALNSKTNKTYQETEALKEQQAQLQKVIELERQYLGIQKTLKEIDNLKTRKQELKAEESGLKDAIKKAEDVQQRTRETSATLEKTATRQSDELKYGRKAAEEAAADRARRTQAEELAKGTTFDKSKIKQELDRQAEVQKLIDKNQGSAKERGESRRAQRAADREQGRNDKRTQAALKRENDKRKREGKDPIDQPVQDNIDPKKQADKALTDAIKSFNKNAASQLKAQESMEKLIKKIEPKLPTAALGA